LFCLDTRLRPFTLLRVDVFTATNTLYHTFIGKKLLFIVFFYNYPVISSLNHHL